MSLYTGRQRKSRARILEGSRSVICEFRTRSEPRLLVSERYKHFLHIYNQRSDNSDNGKYTNEQRFLRLNDSLIVIAGLVVGYFFYELNRVSSMV